MLRRGDSRHFDLFARSPLCEEGGRALSLTGHFVGRTVQRAEIEGIQCLGHPWQWLRKICFVGAQSCGRVNDDRIKVPVGRVNRRPFSDWSSSTAVAGHSREAKKKKEVTQERVCVQYLRLLYSRIAKLVDKDCPGDGDVVDRWAWTRRRGAGSAWLGAAAAIARLPEPGVEESETLFYRDRSTY